MPVSRGLGLRQNLAGPTQPAGRSFANNERGPMGCASSSAVGEGREGKDPNGPGSRKDRRNSDSFSKIKPGGEGSFAGAGRRAGTNSRKLFSASPLKRSSSFDIGPLRGKKGMSGETTTQPNMERRSSRMKGARGRSMSLAPAGEMRLQSWGTTRGWTGGRSACCSTR